VERDGLRLLAIVLGSDGPYLSDTQTRYNFVDSAALYDWAFATFTRQELCARGQVLSRREIETARGRQELCLLSADDFSALFPRGEQPQLELDLPPGILDGPVLAGQPLGLAHFQVDGCDYGSVLLLADRTVLESFLPDLRRAIFG
jgi:D-alanyl-D-alanine carboxypeptidase